jgi:hypothetical protein
VGQSGCDQEFETTFALRDQARFAVHSRRGANGCKGYRYQVPSWPCQEFAAVRNGLPTHCWGTQRGTSHRGNGLLRVGDD